MKDYLLDLVGHTHDLGCFDLIKVVGTDAETKVVGISTELDVVLYGDFKNPIPEFAHTFGMPNLAKLKILLNLPEYKEDATISTTKDAAGVPDGLEFTNSIGDFKNRYRFMGNNVVSEKLKTPKFHGAKWDVEFEPTVAAIQRLKMQAQANAEEPNFQSRTENGDLKFYFGDHSTHAGNFVFQSNVGAQLKRNWSWPVSPIVNILSLSGDKTFRISDAGALQITIDSGIAVYNYIISAQTK